MSYMYLFAAGIAGVLFAGNISEPPKKADPFHSNTHRCVQIELVNGNDGPEYRCSRWKPK